MIKAKNIIIILLAVSLIVLISINIFCYSCRIKYREGYKYISIGDIIEKLENNRTELKDINSVGIVDTLNLLFYDKSLWQKLPLSSSFRNKYSAPKSLIKKYNKYESISTGAELDYKKDNVVSIYCIERDSIFSLINNRNISTIYYFEYILDANNQLDDLILLKEVDIDSMTAETYAVREY